MKRLTVALTALVFALTAVFINPLYTGAVGVDTAVKLVGGKAVVRAVAEKTGLALSPRQLDNVVDLVEKKTYDGDTEVIEWVNKANLVKSNPSTTPSEKTGFKKYVLDPMMWLTGADLIFEAINAFQDGYDTGTTVDLFKECKKAQYNSAGTLIDLNNKNYVYQHNTSTNKDNLYVYSGAITVSNYYTSGKQVVFSNGFSQYTRTHGTTNYSSTVYTTTGSQTIVFLNSETGELTFTQDEGICATPVVAEDLIDTKDVSDTVITNFDNDTYNTNTTYNMEIEIPDNENYNDTTPWNEKDIEIENNIVVPPPVIVDPDPDPDPDGDEVIGAVLVKGDPIETPSNFFTLMGSMGAKMHDMYNGVIKFFSDSVDGMEKMLVGSAGLVTFMTGYFDIFPDEFTNVLMVAVMLGFIMHFFRR